MSQTDSTTPAEPIVLYYSGDGMHSIPGLPMRDLTQADIDSSPYRDDPAQILKFEPPVFQPKQADSTSETRRRVNEPASVLKPFVAPRALKE